MDENREPTLRAVEPQEQETEPSIERRLLDDIVAAVKTVAVAPNNINDQTVLRTLEELIAVYRRNLQTITDLQAVVRNAMRALGPGL